MVGPGRTAGSDRPSGGALAETPQWRQQLAFFSVLAATCCSVLESMAVGVALPDIASSFDVTPAVATWVLGASQIAIVALLLPMSALGETLGYRGLYLASLLGFIVTTFVCLAAPDFGVLIAARIAQSVSVAGMMSVNFALVREIVPEKHLGRAIGVLAATVATASSAGPAIAGAILTIGNWRWVFGFMIPFGVVALLVGYFLLPATTGTRRPLDWVGALLTAIMLASLVSAIYAVTNGWPRLIGLGLLILGSLSAYMVRRGSRNHEAPIFPFDLLQRPIFLLSITASICAFSAQAMAFVTLPFILLFRFSLSELEMALVLSIWPLTIAVLAPVIGRVSERIAAGPVGSAGLVSMAIGLVLLATAPVESDPIAIGWRMVICGLGFGLFQTPNNRLVMLTAPRERSGAASGMIALARQFGRAIGTAIAAIVLATGTLGDASIALVIAALAALISAVLSYLRHVFRPNRNIPGA